MANITVPIQLHLPDDLVEQIVNRLRNDPESEWVEIVRCKDCKRFDKRRGCNLVEGLNIAKSDSFCSYAERREG